MEIVGVLIMALGGIVMLVGGIMMLIKIFQTSVIWGIGSLLVPFVSLIWLIMHWSEGKKPFLIQLGGFVLMVVGMLLGGAGGSGQ